jgi:hypothetical protein
VRYTGIAGYGDFNLKFYGVASDSNPEDFAFEFNVKGFFLLQELIFRIQESNFFCGWSLFLVFYNKAFGGDFNYTKTKLSSFSYWPVADVV